MKFIVSLLVVASSIILLTGCSAAGPKFSKMNKPEKDKSLIYVYRPKSSWGKVVTFDIHAKSPDGKDIVIGNLKNGGYLQYMAQPNEIEFWAKTESTSSVTLDVEANRMYCIKGEVGIGFFVGRPNLTLVNNNLCSVELRSTVLSEEANEDQMITEPELLPDSPLKCARMKGGNTIQSYSGFIKNNKIIINNKDYSHKYQVIDISIEEIERSGATGHFCNIVKF